MHDETTEILTGCLLEDAWLTIDQAAAACRVEPAWLQQTIEEGLLPEVHCMAGTWRLSARSILRARRMRSLERDFDAVPELAALMADLLEELDALRERQE